MTTCNIKIRELKKTINTKREILFSEEANSFSKLLTETHSKGNYFSFIKVIEAMNLSISYGSLSSEEAQVALFKALKNEYSNSDDGIISREISNSVDNILDVLRMIEEEFFESFEFDMFSISEFRHRLGNCFNNSDLKTIIFMIRNC